jgi:drug/metabolite transporter (DMT)-like permease
MVVKGTDDASSAMRIRDIALVVTVAFLWAICFPLIEIGLEGAPPLVFAAMRAALSGALLIAAAVWLRRPWPRGLARHGLIAAAGLSFTALGFGGMFLGGGKIPPGLATVLANTQPLIAAVLAVVFLSERLTPRLGTGLLLGFLGVAVMSLPSLSGPDHAAGMQALFWITLGAVGTAVGNVLFKALAGQGDILVITGLQLLVGAVALALGAQFMDQDWRVVWTARFIVSLLGLAVFGTAVVTVIWYYLLHRLPLNRLNPFTFLTPVFGLLLGGLFFGERLGLIEVAGIAVTVFAIQLVATRTDTG